MTSNVIFTSKLTILKLLPINENDNGKQDLISYTFFKKSKTTMNDKKII